MLEIRFHGRGGQGAVVASKMLAVAFFKEGKGVQSFPTYGAERRGAPVAAFIRVDDKPVLYHHNIYNPTHVVVLDPSLMERVDVAQGLKEGGFVLIDLRVHQEASRHLRGRGPEGLPVIVRRSSPCSGRY